MKHIKRSIIWFVRWLLPSRFREGVLYAIAAVFLTYLNYALFIDTRVWETIRSEVLTPRVVAGENFQIAYQIEWSSSCQVTGFRFIVDGAGFQHERVRDVRMVDAGLEDFVISIPVPRGAAPGEAVYTGVVQYICNPVQRFIAPMEIPLRPRPFSILPPAENISLSAERHGNIIQLSEW